MGSPHPDRQSLKPFLIDGRGFEDPHVQLLDRSRNLALYSGLVLLHPGEHVGEHSTEDHEEMLVILEGNAQLLGDGKPVLKLSAGQFGYVPPHSRHDVVNCGQTDLRYVYIVAPV